MNPGYFVSLAETMCGRRVLVVKHSTLKPWGAGSNSTWNHDELET